MSTGERFFEYVGDDLDGPTLVAAYRDYVSLHYGEDQQPRSSDQVNNLSCFLRTMGDSTGSQLFQDMAYDLEMAAHVKKPHSISASHEAPYQVDGLLKSELLLDEFGVSSSEADRDSIDLVIRNKLRGASYDGSYGMIHTRVYGVLKKNYELAVSLGNLPRIKDQLLKAVDVLGEVDTFFQWQEMAFGVEKRRFVGESFLRAAGRSVFKHRISKRVAEQLAVGSDTASAAA